MSIEIRRIQLQGSPLFQAYIDDHASVASFYNAGDPHRLDSYRQITEQLRDGRPRGAFVSTGQQAGLFVSPLYTVYKALSAARLAEVLQDRLGIPVMPLFTVASEDHDWAEVDHTHILDLENRLMRLSVSGPGAAEPGGASPPVERIPVPEDIEDALATLVQATPNSEFKVSVLDPLRRAYRPGHGFAEAFEDALRGLLAGYPFLLYRTAGPFVKRHTSEILQAEWDLRDESAARLAERGQALSAAGFEEQVPQSAGATNLFFEGELGRDRIMFEASHGRLRRSGAQLSNGELKTHLRETPERVSPGALLRPVSEARAFPVIAYVGGPSEIAYLAQSQALFTLHGVPAPVVVPRSSFQLVEAKVSKVLAKYEVEAEELAGDRTAAINRLLKARTPPELQEALNSLRATVGAALDGVESAALDFDPGSKSAMGSGKHAVFESVVGLEAKLQARVREKHQVMQAQLEKAAVNLYPNGQPQERVLNPYPYLVRYGHSLLERIYDKVEIMLE
jgi:bacillithiol biosynthesis cysteine-adding enzyme BshC